ncbi:hypothetical protein Aperf_G00000028697 [Anoplocephala perfoliata]
MVEATVDSLYKCFDTISDATSSEAQKLKAFQIIQMGCKGGPNEKKLSSQFIGRFFKLFPNEQEKSFNCLLDICDDDDPKARIQVVRDLQQICRAESSFIPRVSDVLGQMIVTEDVLESNVVMTALKTLLETDPSGTLAGIFNQIFSSKSGLHRQTLIKFLTESLKDFPEEKMSSKLEEFIVEQSNRLLNETSPGEFVDTITLMSSLKSMSTLLGRQKLVNMITNLVTERMPVFNPRSVYSVELVQKSGKQLVHLLSKNVSAAQFLKYMVVSVVPLVLLVENSFQQRGILQVLADVSSHPGDAFTSTPLEKQVQLLQILYTSLLTILPDTSPSGNDVPSKIFFPAFTVECIFYTLLNLLKFCPTFFHSSMQNDSDTASLDGVTRLQTLRQKAQYTARLIQSYKPSIVSELQAAFLAEGGCSVKTADEARRALANIEKMVRCIFRSQIEPDCLHDVVLSWIEPTSQTVTPVTSTGVKRPAPVTDLVSGNKQRRFQQTPRSFPVRGRGGGFRTGRGRLRRF